MNPKTPGPARFAILSDNEIHDSNGPRPLSTSRVRTFAQLLRIGTTTGNKQLWLLPGSELFRRIKTEPGPFFEQSEGWQLRPSGQLAALVSGWRPGTTFSKVQILMPGIVKSQWELDNVTDSRLMFAAVAKLGQLLNVSPTNPIDTGRQIIDRQAGRSWPLPEVNDYPAYWLPFLEHGEADLVFKRPLLPTEQAARWLHVIDKKRQYLTACNVPLGVGEYRHALVGGAIIPKGHKVKPGLYKVLLGGDGFTSDYAFLRDFDTKAPRWVYAPMVQVALDLGFRVEVLEAYSWPRAHRLLEHFNETVNGAMKRTEAQLAEGADPVNVIVRGCLKAVYTRLFGWLAAEREDGRKDRLYRPDIWWQVIASAKARLLRNLNDGMQAGAFAAGCRIDALFFFSDEPDWQKALPPPFTGPGCQYKLSYTVPADAAEFERHGTIVDVDEHCKRLARRGAAHDVG